MSTTKRQPTKSMLEKSDTAFRAKELGLSWDGPGGFSEKHFLMVSLDLSM